MPTDWAWHAGVEGEWSYDLATEEPTREAAIAQALRNAEDGETIQIVEARMSTALKYDDADEIPFTHTRNHEIIGTKGPAGLIGGTA
ncbi:hypothetical protein IWY39_000046 [Sphingobium sp. JAI105]|uniref:hypothetical protein n=1 Tax=Sphingobium sp. JAI105 TaxID=2787715 RepID=UPI0018CA4F78|nr:hypothetical protein [Sphingobium sp. JAI105]MBG6116242.1 hypothetical protein [Sphingobium sp. JAI105]